ncbi:unnamed protein product [Protopolystoma xenopodis]|uniref:Eukaryotic translation initiation factor 5 n=1 Tax=Protopolystoma xenopodis TaxID=117903 RepID=A0A448WD03_9PLAT|nr:unnamed protein product [Protopolystoma xenopodis]
MAIQLSKMEVNINREVEDTFYRYKMPKLAAKVEGKGNGIKTVIVNVIDIAKALYRKPIYVTKYFGCELGAQVHVDEKNERYIVNGAHEASKLQELLDGFIKKFVLCQSCGNPETTLRVKRNAGVVTSACKACGSQGQLDVGHRLTQFIVKNPPDVDNTTSTKSKGKKSKKNGGDQDSGEDMNCEDGGQPSPNFADFRADEDDWGEDTTLEAQLRRINELSAMAKSLALSIDVEKSETERADIFFKHLERLLKQGLVVDRRKEIKQEADRLDLGPRVTLVLAEVLLNDPNKILDDVKAYRTVFMQFTRSGEYHKKAQQYLLGAMTSIIGKFSSSNLVSRSCHILKTLYDCDIVEEETIIAWYDKGPSKKYVSKELSSKILSICSPMIKWLKEAEEEDSDSASEDSFDDTKAIPDAQRDTRELNGSSQKEDDDDIDIDAI